MATHWQLGFSEAEVNFQVPVAVAGLAVFKLPPVFIPPPTLRQAGAPCRRVRTRPLPPVATPAAPAQSPSLLKRPPGAKAATSE